MAEPIPGGSVQAILVPDEVQQSVTVTADRGLAGVGDQSTDVVVVTGEQLAAPPALALDDRLHQVAGFQLYRRTSSWTANPTTEGVSLRGLGSTAASRTLVVSDQVPLNDPFGGWIHWDEIPVLAISDVQLVRGGAADLYGSSAIGGVIDIDPVTATSTPRVLVSADALGATENSASGDLVVSAALRPVSILLAGSGVDTGGYIPTAPAFRGLVDIPSNVAEESGRLELRTPTRNDGDTAFVRGNVLNEARSNGTPDQTNGTRFWRYSGGGDLNSGLGHAALRVFGDREAYRQSFSSIAANRNSETLTRLQHVPTDEFGFSLTGSHTFASTLVGGLGLDLRDIRATDTESPLSKGVVTSTTDISAHQREIGGYAEGIWQPKQWSIAASIRVDSFRTFDGRQVATNTSVVTAEPETDELVASPHLGVVRNLPHGLALTASAFRAFRGPTMNELYRTGQVGQQTTLANPSLLAERATGFEFGGEFANLRARGHNLGYLRASYFWTEVNRPVSAVLLSQTATTQTLQRQNLGQIRSRGLSLEATTTRWRGVDASVGYQLAVATVTAFNTSSAAQANLTGNWIPEVPRESLTGTANYAASRVA
ncbi:MAG: TonB-dependent receptor plug domain-containing protein, partial [Janthinobacterium lividum]